MNGSNVADSTEDPQEINSDLSRYKGIKMKTTCYCALGHFLQQTTVHSLMLKYTAVSVVLSVSLLLVHFRRCLSSSASWFINHQNNLNLV